MAAEHVSSLQVAPGRRLRLFSLQQSPRDMQDIESAAGDERAGQTPAVITLVGREVETKLLLELIRTSQACASSHAVLILGAHLKKLVPPV